MSVVPGDHDRAAYEMEPEPIRLLAIVNRLLARRWTIIAATVLAGAIGAAYGLMQPPVWTATAKFLPMRSPGVASRMGAMVGGANLDEGEDTSADYYIALVQSPTFLEGVVTDQYADDEQSMRTLVDIMDVKGDSERERVMRATEALGKAISISAAKAVGAAQSARLITLSVPGSTPALAAKVADNILKRIAKHGEEGRGAKSRQNREFVEKQLAAANRLFLDGTDALATFSARNRKIATPDLQAEQDRLKLAVRVQEEVVTTLTKQLELAKIQEQEGRESIEILQSPEPPLNRTSPKRTQLAVVFAFGGFAIACAIVLVLGWLRSRNGSDPDAAEFRTQIGGIGRDLRRVLTLGLR